MSPSGSCTPFISSLPPVGTHWIRDKPGAGTKWDRDQSGQSRATPGPIQHLTPKLNFLNLQSQVGVKTEERDERATGATKIRSFVKSCHRAGDLVAAKTWRLCMSSFPLPATFCLQYPLFIKKTFLKLEIEICKQNICPSHPSPGEPHHLPDFCPFQAPPAPEK